MKIHYITPYSIEKNLGRAYNEAMEMIPDGDSVCFTDGDSMFTRPDFGHVIHEYAVQNPSAVLTCLINRIHPLAVSQLFVDRYAETVEECLKSAIWLKNEFINNQYSTTIINGTVSGTLLVIPKHIWHKVPFTETNRYRVGETNMLGVDNAFTNDVRKAGFQVLRMNSVLLYHQYRRLSDGKDKSHLL